MYDLDLGFSQIQVKKAFEKIGNNYIVKLLQFCIQRSNEKNIFFPSRETSKDSYSFVSKKTFKLPCDN